MLVHDYPTTFPSIVSFAETAMNGTATGPASTDSDFLELGLMLPSWQLFALDDLARKRGLNVGQLLRRLIGNMLEEMAEKA